ncbi:MAG: NosD domain-containing protein, partial [Flavobacteriales bacterium]
MPFLSWNWSNGWSFPPAYYCNIVNNCIKKYDYGINMETFREPFIDFNYIYRSETAGIRFVNSFDGTIYRNNLVGVNGFSLKGLRITDSENMGIIANQMTYFKEAVHVDGSARNHFLLNALKNSDYGIVINGSIGAQG